MGRPPFRVDLFAEDEAHERFLTALVRRLGRDEGVAARLRPASARGGHARALEELRLFQRVRPPGIPDLLVVVIDANCTGWNDARASVAKEIDATAFPNVVVTCPDPHAERWFLADPPSLAAQLGVTVAPQRRKCVRDLYKRVLKGALRDAGHVLTLDGIEFADEIVDAMDLFAAGKREPSLRHCVDGIRAALRVGR